MSRAFVLGGTVIALAFAFACARHDDARPLAPLPPPARVTTVTSAPAGGGPSSDARARDERAPDNERGHEKRSADAGVAPRLTGTNGGVTGVSGVSGVQGGGPYGGAVGGTIGGTPSPAVTQPLVAPPAPPPP